AAPAEWPGLSAAAFPDVAAKVRVAVVARYLAQNTWAADPILRQPRYQYLQQILLDGGFLKHRHRYEDLIDTSIAQAVVSGGSARSAAATHPTLPSSPLSPTPT